MQKLKAHVGEKVADAQEQRGLLLIVTGRNAHRELVDTVTEMQEIRHAFNHGVQARHRQHEQWQEENREAIAHYNQQVEKHGVFSDDLRSF